MSRQIEWTFNVQNDCQAFESRIGDLRYRVRDLARPEPLYDGLYMLRPYTAVPQQWVEVTMQDGSTNVMVWVRADNLYVVGFRGRNGVTWEFGQRSDQDWQQLIAGSVPLGFDGGYTGRNLGELLTGPPRRPDLGRQQLRDAIGGLARYTGGGGEELRTWLRTMVVTISESVRSQRVCTYVGGLLRDGSSGWLSSELVCIIRNWEKVCVCLIESANNPDKPGQYRYLQAKGVCSNTYEARKVVAIVYHGPATSQRQKRSATADQDPKVDDVATGLTFVEVLAVVVENIDGEDPGDLYGAATVDDGLDPVDVFRRERRNAQSVRPGGCAEMTGPSRAVWGYDEVVFDLDLMDADSIPDMSPDDQISKGQVIWNAHQKPERAYNTAKECTVEGDYGAVKIRYAVFTDAVVATVEVRLTNGDDESHPDLYGSIRASTYALPDHKMLLFNKGWRDCVSLSAGDMIPLLRSVFVVPRGSYLRVEADLWDRDVLPDMSPDDQIANEGAWFSTMLEGTQTRELNGPHGHVTVYVTWSKS